MLKLYWLAIIIVAVFVGNIGFLLPLLISSSSTELVLLGCMLIVVEIPIFYMLCKKFVTLITYKNEEID